MPKLVYPPLYQPWTKTDVRKVEICPSWMPPNGCDATDAMQKWVDGTTGANILDPRKLVIGSERQSPVKSHAQRLFDEPPFVDTVQWAPRGPRAPRSARSDPKCTAFIAPSFATAHTISKRKLDEQAKLHLLTVCRDGVNGVFGRAVITNESARGAIKANRDWKRARSLFTLLDFVQEVPNV